MAVPLQGIKAWALTGVCAALVGAAVLGPDWEEGKNDAGDLLETARAIPAPPGNPPLNSIGGCLGCGASENDLVDLFVIWISDPTTFQASTAAIDGGAAAFDSKLLLFDASGHAILGNDDVSPVNTASRIRGEATVPCDWDVRDQGLYFLAITSSGRHALVDSVIGMTDAFPVNENNAIFCATDYGHANVLDGWYGRGSQGTYLIALSGVAGVPACLSDCPEDLSSDGVVDGADLGVLIGMWGTATCTDLAGGPTIDAADLGILLAAWGPC